MCEGAVSFAKTAKPQTWILKVQLSNNFPITKRKSQTKENTTEICQGYKGEAKVEMCSDAEEPYSLSGCGPKRCIEPTPRASKYYKLEVRKGIETNRFHKNKELANLKKRGLWKDDEVWKIQISVSWAVWRWFLKSLANHHHFYLEMVFRKSHACCVFLFINQQESLALFVCIRTNAKTQQKHTHQTTVNFLLFFVKPSFCLKCQQPKTIYLPSRSSEGLLGGSSLLMGPAIIMLIDPLHPLGWSQRKAMGFMISSQPGLWS